MNDELVGRIGKNEIWINRENKTIDIMLTNVEYESEIIYIQFEELDDWIKLLWKARNMIQPKAVLCRECRYYLPRRCGLDNHVVSGKKALCTRGVKKE